MRQSTVIFGTLVLAFVIYITLRGQLPAYLSLFTGASVQTNTGASNATPNSTKDIFEQFDDVLKNMGFK